MECQVCQKEGLQGFQWISGWVRPKKVNPLVPGMKNSQYFNLQSNSKNFNEKENISMFNIMILGLKLSRNLKCDVQS